jgi:SAM-dependent MidA family methyltransferase
VTARDVILSRIREHGPMTLAEYMDIALYHPEYGYYTGAAQRSGRAGDFYTSVDVGPLFGELLAVQFAEMDRLQRAAGSRAGDLVEAAAGNGRLSRDVLDAAAAEHPEWYAAVRLSLCEPSAAARGMQPGVLGPHVSKLVHASADLPPSVAGVIFANELLDAMPAHAVVMRGGRLREVYVAERDGTLVEQERALSTPDLEAWFERVGEPLAEGSRAEVSLAAASWVAGAAAALTRGFLLLVDYGRPARDLYSGTHAGGTLMAYRSHVASSAWLERPGEVDLTTHVDLTAVQRTAEAAGLTPLGAVDQTYFLTALGLAERLTAGDDRRALSRRMAAKTLIMPGSLGSTMKVMIFAKGVGRPALRGLSAGRLT